MEVEREAVPGTARTVLVRAPEPLVPLRGLGRVLDRPRVDDEAGESDRACQHRDRKHLRRLAREAEDDECGDDAGRKPEDEEEDLQRHEPHDHTGL